MHISSISAQEIGHTVYNVATQVFNASSQYLGKFYTWLSVNGPIWISQAHQLAQKIAVTVTPLFNSMCVWAIENAPFLTPFALGVVTTVALSYLFASKKPTLQKTLRA